MDSLSTVRKLDPIKSLQLCYYACAKSITKNMWQIDSDVSFWNHPKFNNWKSTQGSALIMVKGDYKTRQMVKSFAMNIVRLLRQNDVPVVWALKSPHGNCAETISAIDVTKDLICQILRLNISMHTEQLFSLSCAQFRTAEASHQWFDLLATVLDHLPLLYIVIDIEVVSTAYAKSTKDFSWLSSFNSIVQGLSKRQSRMKLKVLIVSYGSASLQETNLVRFQELVVSTRQSVQRPQRQARHPIIRR